MKNDLHALSSLTNEQLLARVKTLAADERAATATLLASLAELDARRVYLGEGYASLFTYCTQALHLAASLGLHRITTGSSERCVAGSHLSVTAALGGTT